ARLDSISSMGGDATFFLGVPPGRRPPQRRNNTAATTDSTTILRQATACPQRSMEKPPIRGPMRFEVAPSRLNVVKFVARFSGGLSTPTRFWTFTRKNENASPTRADPA